MSNKSLNITYNRFKLNISIAIEALVLNKLRSLLSALGIIFGVSAVICMISIGNGTEKEILDKMKAVGVNNIVISPFSETRNTTTNSSDKKDEEKSGPQTDYNNFSKRAKYSPGLTINDIASIKDVMPNVVRTSGYIEKVMFAIHNNRYSNATVKAVSNDYFEMFNHTIKEGGTFNINHEKGALPVCILSENAKYKLFGAEYAIGKQVKIGKLWFTVLGVIQNIMVSKNTNKESDISIYVPIQSYLLRIENNSKKANTRNAAVPNNNTNQLNKIYVQIEEADDLKTSAQVISRILYRTHQGVKDYEVTVPELLLKQQEETKSIFNVVLGIIAGISLLVGGIGIMNIMNASVLERTREIGVRMATGANKQDISLQFLAEAVLICLSGGVIGIIVGVIMSVIITKATDIETIITPGSIIISFFITSLVGIFFGFYPAKKASSKDPIESLRYE